MRAARVIGVGLLAAVIAGVTVGSISRVLMRLVTLAADHRGAWSWSGTAFILALFTVVMIPAGVAAASTTRRARWLVAVAGAAVLVPPAIGVASEEIGEIGGLSPLRWIALVVTSAAVFATIVVAPIVTVRVADHLSAPRRPVRTPEPAPELVGSSLAERGG